MHEITKTHSHVKYESNKQAGSVVRIHYNTATYRCYPHEDYVYSYAQSPSGCYVKKDDYALIVEIVHHWCRFVHLDTGELGWLPVHWVSVPCVQSRALQSSHD